MDSLYIVRKGRVAADLDRWMRCVFCSLCPPSRCLFVFLARSNSWATKISNVEKEWPILVNDWSHSKETCENISPQEPSRNTTKFSQSKVDRKWEGRPKARSKSVGTCPVGAEMWGEIDICLRKKQKYMFNKWNIPVTALFWHFYQPVKSLTYQWI